MKIESLIKPGNLIVCRIEMEELAKRAVKCKAWRWMPGMSPTINGLRLALALEGR